MKVVNFMIQDVCTAAPTVSVEGVAKLMHDHRCGSVVIIDDGALVGIVTGRDVVKAVATGADPPSPIVTGEQELVTANPEMAVWTIPFVAA